VGDPDLTQLSDAELEAKVQALLAEMAPREQELQAIRIRLQLVVTEQRRRERAQHRQARMQVRAVVAEGHMPTLEEAVRDELLIPGDGPLDQLSFFRDSGTQVGLGYATSRQPSFFMTDGAQHVPIRSLAEARSRYREGWDFGTAQTPGVRIHIPNSRTEKVLPAGEVFVKAAE
jgi:hypothetical protein